MKTEAEVVAFLDSKVGTTIKDKVNSNLNGQCVTEIKALLEFLGVSNPYAARGNAKDYATNLVNAGIATNDKGSVNVVVNPTMGVVGNNVYGHIWTEIDGQNWESNGAKALIVTKNTRPSIQGRQWVNLDKWITNNQGGNMGTTVDRDLNRIIHSEMEGWNLDDVHSGKHDAAFAAAWGGRDLKEMITEKWNKNGAFRAQRERNRKFYDQYASVIADLPNLPTKAQLDEALAKLAAEAKKVEKANAEAEAARKALLEEQANKSEDSKLIEEGKGFFTKLLKRWGLK